MDDIPEAYTLPPLPSPPPQFILLLLLLLESILPGFQLLGLGTCWTLSSHLETKCPSTDSPANGDGRLCRGQTGRWLYTSLYNRGRTSGRMEMLWPPSLAATETGTGRQPDFWWKWSRLEVVTTGSGHDWRRHQRHRFSSRKQLAIWCIIIYVLLVCCQLACLPQPSIIVFRKLRLMAADDDVCI